MKTSIFIAFAFLFNLSVGALDIAIGKYIWGTILLAMSVMLGAILLYRLRGVQP